MTEDRLSPGDEVVHQGEAGRFCVVRVRRRPAMNVYSDIVTIRSPSGEEIDVLASSVRKLAPKSEASEDGR